MSNPETIITILNLIMIAFITYLCIDVYILHRKLKRELKLKKMLVELDVLLTMHKQLMEHGPKKDNKPE